MNAGGTSNTEMQEIKKKKRNNLMKKIMRRWQLYLLLSVGVIHILIFAYGPMAGLVIAFKDFNVRDGVFGSPWVGLENFERFLTSYNFGMIIKNTLTISIYSLLAGYPIPIIFALMLNALPGKRFKKAVQTVTYMPHFISTVVMVSLVFQLLNYRTGLYGSIYRFLFGTFGPDLLAKGQNFKHIYVWSGIWQGTGYSSIIYIAALAGVDMSLHEAAEIDGASRLQRIWHIDIPAILPTASIMLILAAGGIMNVGFEKVYLMQNGLNVNFSEVISTYTYKVGVISSIPDFSYGTAIGMFNSVINFVMLLVANWGSKKLSGSGIF